jgi:hypothetical protein
MKRALTLFAILIFTSMFAHGQSACAQLGVDCSHPTVEQRPQNTCGPQCRAQEEQENEEYWERRKAYDQERAAEKERERERKAEEKATKEKNKRIDAANKLAAQAWEAMQKENCANAIALYDRALALNKFEQWSVNRAACQSKSGNYDAAYASFEALINDPSTPDADIRGMRNWEWSIMFDKGYRCPQPPLFDGINGCYARPDRNQLDGTYVPLPYIEGKYWTPKQVLSSGSFTVTTKDGHVYKSGEVNMTTINMMNARIQTSEHAAVRFVLPDSTTFVLGPHCDMTIDDFVYDPNKNSSSMTMRVISGLFRFVSGEYSHPDPATKLITIPWSGKHVPQLPAESYPQKSNTELRREGHKVDPCSYPSVEGCIIADLRGTDFEVEHDPDARQTIAGTKEFGDDRWWLCTYDGDVHVTYSGDAQAYDSPDHVTGGTLPVPVGTCFIKFDSSPQDQFPHHSAGTERNYADNPNDPNDGLYIAPKSQLAVTDFWEKEMAPKPVGRF